MAVNENAVAGVTTKVSPRPVAETVARLTGSQRITPGASATARNRA